MTFQRKKMQIFPRGRFLSALFCLVFFTPNVDNGELFAEEFSFTRYDQVLECTCIQEDPIVSKADSNKPVEKKREEEPIFELGQIEHKKKPLIEYIIWPIFHFIDEDPSFLEGDLMSFLTKNLRYPEEARKNDIEGLVIISFVIERDGSISNPTIVRGVCKSLNEEALRVVRIMPKWKPASMRGVPVRVKFNLPVRFKLQD